MAACFAALVLHTMTYADFLEDPVTWTLLGIGSALALAGGTPTTRAGSPRGARAGRRELSAEPPGPPAPSTAPPSPATPAA